MLCPRCRCQVARDAGFCGACGAPVGNGSRGGQPLVLVLPDGAQLVLAETLTIGRTPANGVGSTTR